MAKNDDEKIQELVDQIRKICRTSYNCACPECGKKCKYDLSFEGVSPVPVRIQLECAQCGSFEAVHDMKADLWSIKGTDIPYIPGAEDNIATLYHRFDPSQYDDEISAVSAEADLLGRLVQTYTDNRMLAHFERICGKWDETITRAYELGIKKYYGTYVKNMLLSLLDEKPSEEHTREVLETSLEIIDEMDADGLEDVVLACTALMTTNLNVDVVLDKASERLHDVCMDYPDDPEHLMALFRVINIFDHNENEEYIGDIIDKALCLAKTLYENDPGNESLLVKTYIHSLYYLTVDEATEALEFITPIRDRYPLDYLEMADYCASLVYHDRGNEGGLALKTVNLLIEFINDYPGDIDNDLPIVERLAFRAYKFRFDIEGEKRDLRQSIDIAFTIIQDSDDGDIVDFLYDCLDNPMLNKTEKNIIKKKMKQNGYRID